MLAGVELVVLREVSNAMPAPLAVSELGHEGPNSIARLREDNAVFVSTNTHGADLVRNRNLVQRDSTTLFVLVVLKRVLVVRLVSHLCATARANANIPCAHPPPGRPHALEYEAIFLSMTASACGRPGGG